MLADRLHAFSPASHRDRFKAFRLRPCFSALFLAFVAESAVIAQTTTLRRLFPPNEIEVGGEFGGIARGDFDQDGTLDLAIGQPSDISPGRVVIRSGATGGAIRVLVAAGAPEPGDGFGTSLLKVDDLDNDGISDLVVSLATSPSAPRVEAYSSATGQRIWSLGSPSSALGFGWSLSPLADLNGDGRQEIIIGAPFRNLVQVGGIPIGAGASAARVVIASGIDGSVLQVLQSQGNPGLAPSFGASAISIGDLDGDSVPEIVSTAGPGAPTPGLEVQVFSGATGSFVGMLAQRSLARLSPSLVNHVDVNGDGLQDILLCYRSDDVSGTRIVECLSGSGGGSLWSRLSPAGGDGAQSVMDADGDSVNDVFIANVMSIGANPSYALLSGATGIPIWTAIQSSVLNHALTHGNPVTVDEDRDGDGRNDLLVTTSRLASGNALNSVSSASGVVLSVRQSRSGNEGFGTSVMPTTDLDGDGLGDVLIGAPRFGTSVLRGCGAAYLMSAATGAVIRRFEGSGTSQALGISLAELGDINSDGVQDLVVGSPLATVAGSAAAGKIDVFSGANCSILWSVSGTLAGARFGSGLLRMPDRNGDGIADLAVSSSIQAAGGPPSIRLLSGANGQVIWTWQSPAAFGSIGSELTDAGDLDGDGVSDLIVNSAVPYQQATFQNESVVILPATTGTLPQMTQTYAISGATGVGIWTVPPAPLASTGFSLAMTTDVNGDGVPDVLSGTPGFPNGGSTANGRIVLLSGADGTLFSIVATGLFGEMFGLRVVALGDLNGDLRSEFGALTTNVLVTGSFPGLLPARNRLRVFSGATFEPIDVVSSAPYSSVFESGGFGYAMKSMSDLNGDGFPELMISSPMARDPVSGLQRGGVDIVSVRPQPTIVPLGSSCPMNVQGTMFVPGIGTSGGVPSVQTGNPGFGITLSGAPPTGLAVLFYGVPATNWNGLALPLNLGPFGYPGCTLELGLDEYVTLALGTSTPGGTLTVSTPIPQIPNLSGVEVLTQWVIQSPQPNGVALGVTGALRIRLL